MGDKGTLAAAVSIRPWRPTKRATKGGISGVGVLHISYKRELKSPQIPTDFLHTHEHSAASSWAVNVPLIRIFV